VLPFIIAGLTTGAVYALAGVGLVLTYKVSGVFNFAFGALAAVAAYVFYELNVTAGLSWPVAAAVAVLVIGPLMGLGMELLARRIQGTSLALRIAATVGLLLAIEAAATLIFGTTTLRTVPVFLAPGHEVKIGGTNVNWSDIITFAFAVLTTLALTIYFRVARRGVAMRAVVDSPDLLGLMGTGPSATRRLGWIIGCSFAAAAGVLFAPLLPLDPVQLTLLVVAAFGAAAIGAFSNLVLTFLGGLTIGVLASLCTKWFTTGLLSGLAPAMPFVVLFAVLLFFPKRYLTGRSFFVPRSRPIWSAPPRLQLGGAVALIVLLAFVPSFAGIHLTDWTVAVATFIVFLSLALLVRTSGQVSLGQVSFMAIGAAAFSHFAVGSGLPWLVALLAAGLIAVPIGAILAVPAIRLGGLYLALATFGFGLLLQNMFYTQNFMFGSFGSGLTMPRPGWGLGGDTAYFYVVLAFAVLAGVIVVALIRGRLGRLLRAMADSPRALETTGTSVNTTRVLVFCLAAFLAAIGGALAGVAETNVSADSYAPLLSLTFFVLVVIVLGSELWVAVIAAAGWVLIPSYVTSSKVATVLQLVFGVSAILVAVTPPPSLPDRLKERIDRLFGRRATHPPAGSQIDGVQAPRVSPGALEIEGLTVRFGGLVAVEDLTLRAPTGAITGLIGPNGAGKTTTFNACSGLVRPSAGRVLIDGKDVSHSGPAARALHGLGRTFQRMELLESLTVSENVAIGVEGGMAGVNPLAHVAASRSQRSLIEARTNDALGHCGLLDLASTPAIALSTGQRRLVELARCLAGDFRILLLDEPSSGLDRFETERFGQILKRVVEERGVGILLVEHDMALVNDVCHTVHVLDFGRKIYEGTADEAMHDPLVRAAYLGDAAVEELIGASAQTSNVEVNL
jgi:ABC-type branched-subunit amino acid transport system ATPase component/branched-subunit amino acid ABC-type transport system permease component